MGSRKCFRHVRASRGRSVWLDFEYRCAMSPRREAALLRRGYWAKCSVGGPKCRPIRQVRTGGTKEAI